MTPHRYWYLFIGVFVGFLAGWNLAPAQAAYDSPSISAYTEAHLTHQPTPIHCDHLPDGWTGYTESYTTEDGRTVFSPDIWLSYSTCRYLTKLLDGVVPENGRMAANALLTLEHESLHIRLASTDEAHVECAAYKNRLEVVGPLPFDNNERAKLMKDSRWAHYFLSADSYLTEC